ncbi:alanine--tRNA ligase-related protein [Spiroplasma cantharicola]|uniref:Alanyl-tRNA synthetase n=1 Tax=Spiroplasma cantharicola TaxID=362837 RepID=A0A0M4K1R4_9MOLU|nr:alanine--tRNA ligase-related protein [Spiroplasma cantharicola]ALD66587.1 alanyl-tRNA synthetase [Spiroplasma cantharicola]
MLKNFKGYELIEVETSVSEFVNKDKFTLMYLQETVFFPESAGQISDQGFIIFNNKEYKILGLAISEDKVVHKVELISDIKVGSLVKAKLDITHRQLVSQNHSAAHLLFDTLRELYPTSIGKGYFNDQNGLRMDMYIEQKISWSNIFELNNVVKQKMATNAKKEEFIVDAKTAKNKYNLAIEFNQKELEGDLRIVKFETASIQLCSGTHVDSLKEIEDFLITSYENKGSGIYRFYAKTKIEEINLAYQNFCQLEYKEVEQLILKYINQNKYGKDDNIEMMLNAWLHLTKKYSGLKEIKWEDYIKFKSLATDLKVQVPDFLIKIESKKKDELYKKYKDATPTLSGDYNLFSINESFLENKDLNFIADLILKNNDNSFVEVFDLESSIYLCKSNSKINALEKMTNHSHFEIKGGGNEKTAQGKIISKNSNSLLN